MILGRRNVPNDVVEGYKFAWLPTKVRCQKTQEGYWIWFSDYYLWKKMFQGNVSKYWIERKYINYEKNRLDRMLKEKGLR